MTPAYCYTNVPSAYMRNQPGKGSEVVSQTFFSEEVSTVDERVEWVKIRTSVDGYLGWVKRKSLCQRRDPYTTEAQVSSLSAHIYKTNSTTSGRWKTLPFESNLHILDSSDSRWIKILLPDDATAYIQKGDITLKQKKLSKREICTFSKKFLNLPYTWGGRSSTGYDCSGFVGMLYRQMGIFLPRDSKDQVLWEGFSPIVVDEVSEGDLIFFGKSSDTISHVGMYIGNGEFIHATVAENAPYIHISKLSDPIWNSGGQFPYRTARTLKFPEQS